MSQTTIHVAGLDINVVGIKEVTGMALVAQFAPYLPEIERASAAYLSGHGGDPQGLEIHKTPDKMRLVRVLGEWDWLDEKSIDNVNSMR